MFPRKRIVQTVAQHRIIDLPVAHAIAPASGCHQIGRRVHVFHAPDDRGLPEPQPDFLCGRGNGLGTGPTDAVYGQGGHFDRHTAVNGGLARGVHFVSSLNNVAHHDRAKLCGIKAGTAQDFGNGDRPKVRGRNGFQAAIVGADRGAHGIAENDFTDGHG